MQRLNRSRTVLTRVAIVVLLATILLAPFTAGPVLADESDGQAGVVIYFDEDDIEYHLVDLPDDEISALELLDLTDVELETEPFSGLGEAVCSIDGTGCPGSDCFCESYSSPAYYWNFYLFEDEQWLPQMSGGSGHTVEPGEIHGWAWTAESPDLPEITLEELRERLAGVTGSPDVTPTVERTPPGNDETSPDPTSSLGDSSASSETEETADETRCLQFTGFLSVVTAIAVWAGFRRYRNEGTT